MSEQQQDLQAEPTLWLRTVEDFQRLPKDKIGHCLRDFELWLHQVAWAREVPGVEVTTRTDAFGWIDDGRHDVNWQINGVDASKLATSEPEPLKLTVDEVADAILARVADALKVSKRGKR
jgi:hypothetical protein